jgi:hypothetical protein
MSCSKDSIWDANLFRCVPVFIPLTCASGFFSEPKTGLCRPVLIPVTCASDSILKDGVCVKQPTPMRYIPIPSNATTLIEMPLCHVLNQVFSSTTCSGSAVLSISSHTCDFVRSGLYSRGGCTSQTNGGLNYYSTSSCLSTSFLYNILLPKITTCNSGNTFSSTSYWVTGAPVASASPSPSSSPSPSTSIKPGGVVVSPSSSVKPSAVVSPSSSAKPSVNPAAPSINPPTATEPVVQVVLSFSNIPENAFETTAGVASLEASIAKAAKVDANTVKVARVYNLDTKKVIFTAARRLANANLEVTTKITTTSVSSASTLGATLKSTASTFGASVLSDLKTKDSVTFQSAAVTVQANSILVPSTESSSTSSNEGLSSGAIVGIVFGILIALGGAYVYRQAHIEDAALMKAKNFTSADPSIAAVFDKKNETGDFKFEMPSNFPKKANESDGVVAKKVIKADFKPTSTTGSDIV